MSEIFVILRKRRQSVVHDVMWPENHVSRFRSFVQKYIDFEIDLNEIFDYMIWGFKYSHEIMAKKKKKISAPNEL